MAERVESAVRHYFAGQMVSEFRRGGGKRKDAYQYAQAQLASQFGEGIRRVVMQGVVREIYHVAKKQPLTPTKFRRIAHEGVTGKTKVDIHVGKVTRTGTGYTFIAAPYDRKKRTGWRMTREGKSLIHNKRYLYFTRTYGVVRLHPDPPETPKNLRACNPYTHTPSGVGAGIIRMLDSTSRGKRAIADDIHSVCSATVTVVVNIKTRKAAITHWMTNSGHRRDYVSPPRQYSMRLRTAEEVRNWLRDLANNILDYPTWIIESEVRVYVGI